MIMIHVNLAFKTGIINGFSWTENVTYKDINHPEAVPAAIWFSRL